ncbi:hypothetical protein BOX15_Mlig012490g2 [Macrostomum lignano]|uniref:Serine/threonine-protein phosphatase PGAM5, mitochondrial n=1 Tax=Macrostomum lignano TaxID=282301 RepID=A0A267E8B1_9PLAT|nr:hypothetical protein BOX15_Mlig012490g2 [Macrostomum lignano]
MSGVLRKCAALFGTAAAIGAYRYYQRFEDGSGAGGTYGGTGLAARFLHSSQALASFTNNFEPSVRWDNNWDRRDPKSLVRPPRNDEERAAYEKALEEAVPKSSRHLILVRHAQYCDGDTDAARCLTELGWQQAELTGQRLKELNLPLIKLHFSTMTRAKQTAEAIRRHLPSSLSAEPCSLLEEGAPVPPEPPAPHYQPSPDTFHQDGARIESAFRRFFHRASASQAEDSYELLVCHANVIRYFVCRALQLPRRLGSGSA